MKPSIPKNAAIWKTRNPCSERSSGKRHNGKCRRERLPGPLFSRCSQAGNREAPRVPRPLGPLVPAHPAAASVCSGAHGQQPLLRAYLEVLFRSSARKFYSLESCHLWCTKCRVPAKQVFLLPAATKAGSRRSGSCKAGRQGTATASRRRSARSRSTGISSSPACGCCWNDQAKRAGVISGTPRARLEGCPGRRPAGGSCRSSTHTSLFCPGQSRTRQA